MRSSPKCIGDGRSLCQPIRQGGWDAGGGEGSAGRQIVRKGKEENWSKMVKKINRGIPGRGRGIGAICVPLTYNPRVRSKVGSQRTPGDVRIATTLRKHSPLGRNPAEIRVASIRVRGRRRQKAATR